MYTAAASTCSGRRSALILALLSAVFQHGGVLSHSQHPGYEGDSCVDDSSSRRGFCTPLYGCPVALGELSRRQPVLCGYVGRDPIVCCPADGDGNHDVTNSHPSNNNGDNSRDVMRSSAAGQTAAKYCSKYSELTYTWVPSLIPSDVPGALQDTCRQRPLADLQHPYPRPQPREFPHMIALGRSVNERDRDVDGILWSCSGTLISDRYVLTSRRCAYDSAGRGRVEWALAGEYDLQDPDDESSTQLARVDDVILPPTGSHAVPSGSTGPSSRTGASTSSSSSSSSSSASSSSSTGASGSTGSSGGSTGASTTSQSQSSSDQYRDQDDGIALIRLQNKLRLSRWVIPACLPPPPPRYDVTVGDVIAGTPLGVVTGWHMSTGQGDMKKVVLDIVPDRECSGLETGAETGADVEQRNTTSSSVVRVADRILTAAGRTRAAEAAAAAANRNRERLGASTDAQTAVKNRKICARPKFRSDYCEREAGEPLQAYRAGVHCMYDVIGVTSLPRSYDVTMTSQQQYCDGPMTYTDVRPHTEWLESVVWNSMDKKEDEIVNYGPDAIRPGVGQINGQNTGFSNPSMGQGIGQGFGQGTGQSMGQGSNQGTVFSNVPTPTYGQNVNPNMGQGIGQNFGQGIGQGTTGSGGMSQGMGQGIGQSTGQNNVPRPGFGQNVNPNMGMSVSQAIRQGMGQNTGPNNVPRPGLGQNTNPNMRQNLGQGIGQGMGLNVIGLNVSRPSNNGQNTNHDNTGHSDELQGIWQGVGLYHRIPDNKQNVGQTSGQNTDRLMGVFWPSAGRDMNETVGQI